LSRISSAFIFDEVDSGIGGRVAEIVGQLLKRLGQQYQVMCVRHLPQVAAMADAQWQVSKSARDGATLSTVSVLKPDERIEEIARMLGGVKITETTLPKCWGWQGRHQLRWKLKARIVRYADDFVVMCRGKTDAPLAAVRHVLERLDLTLNESKTHIVDARQGSFNFLGFAIRVSKGLKTGKSYPHVCPAPKSLVKIKDRITQLTARERTPIPLEDIVGSMNVILRGWANYFHYRNSNGVLEKVKVHAEERLRTHLMERHKVKDRGIGLGRFPSQQLYAKYGLYKVPTTAGWKTAHA
jgi:hypothetical protein